MISLETLRQLKAESEPFPHFVGRGLIAAEDMKAISADFPNITKPGVFYISDLEYGPAFAKLIEAIQSQEMAEIVGEKFGMKLAGKPLMISVRGQCQLKDGRIHNDSKDKIATCLLYLNESWDASGGRLRLLRDSENLDNMITEVPPEAGSIIGFKRTENSWHGHNKFEGQRRSIMFNWLSSDFALAKNVGRHKLSAAIKRLGFSSKSEY